jgi:hypothetical protein
MLLGADPIGTAAMRVRVSDRQLPDLIRHLRATECAVTRLSEDEAEISMRRAPSDDEAQREVEIYLKAWQAMNLGTNAELVG